MDFELTVKHAVACAVQELQDRGLLLTQSQMEEYQQLKENAADRLITGAAAAQILGGSRKRLQNMFWSLFCLHSEHLTPAGPDTFR